MSYMRGRHYLWRDDSHLHVWVANGQDGWKESGWSESHLDADASGVGIPLAVIDDFVAMRLAELVDSGVVEQVVDRALSRYHGNGGCIALEKHAVEIKKACGLLF